MRTTESPGGVFRGPVPEQTPNRLARLGRRLRPGRPSTRDAAEAPTSATPDRRGGERHRRRTPPGDALQAASTAFVFAGGGARGAAQIGMLQSLVAHGIVAETVFGASVGAVNAAAYAGAPDLAGVLDMADQWRLVTSEDVFPHGRIPTPWRFLQQREAVHTNDGLRRIIEAGCVYERIEEARLPLEIVATSLTDGRVRWFDQGPLVEAVLASCALPALFPPVRIDGEAYIDGGVVDNVPISRAFDKGATRVFVLLCGPLHYRPYVAKRPIEAILTAFFIAVHARFARELASLPPGVEVVVITVGSDPVSRYDDFSATDALLAAGRANAEAVLRFWEAGGVGEFVEEEPTTPEHPDSDAAAAEAAAADAAAAGRARGARPGDGDPGADEADGLDSTHTVAADAAADAAADGGLVNGLPRAIAGAYRRPIAVSKAAWNTVRTVSERAPAHHTGSVGAHGNGGGTPGSGAGAGMGEEQEDEGPASVATGGARDLAPDAPASRPPRATDSSPTEV